MNNFMNKDTLIPLGVVFAFLSGALWIDDGLDDNSHKLDILSLKVSTIESGLADQWTKEDMKVWADLLKAQNPDLIIPDPRN